MATVKSKAGKAGGSGTRKSARETAKAQVAAVQRRARLTQILVIGVVAVVVIGIIGSAVIISVVTQNSRRPVAAADAMVTIAGGKQVPIGVDGDAIRLGPADAKATVDLYVDYACPHCKDYDAATAETYEQLLGEGGLAVKFHLLKFQSAPYGAAAGNASAAVVANQPQDWLAFHSALFVNQTEQTSTWQNGDFRAFAEQQGVTNPEALKAIDEGKYASWITSNTNDAVKAQVSKTPTVLMNGEPKDLVTGQQLIDQVHDLLRS
ncbi:DsbA family protein [Microlunatus speluncae]|uniref:DsbA family protein n=1 Tax=Microlunatus speluncae TaxID=2594267 RepID=UPI0012666899|nr:thioredoxin domain-containing protein [Microlunatus speluncae]